MFIIGCVWVAVHLCIWTEGVVLFSLSGMLYPLLAQPIIQTVEGYMREQSVHQRWMYRTRQTQLQAFSMQAEQQATVALRTQDRGPHSDTVIDIILWTILSVFALFSLFKQHYLHSRCLSVFHFPLKAYFYQVMQKDFVLFAQDSDVIINVISGTTPAHGSYSELYLCCITAMISTFALNKG